MVILSPNNFYLWKNTKNKLYLPVSVVLIMPDLDTLLVASLMTDLEEVEGVEVTE